MMIDEGKRVEKDLISYIKENENSIHLHVMELLSLANCNHSLAADTRVWKKSTRASCENQLAVMECTMSIVYFIIIYRCVPCLTLFSKKNSEVWLLYCKK